MYYVLVCLVFARSGDPCPQIDRSPGYVLCSPDRFLSFFSSYVEMSETVCFLVLCCCLVETVSVCRVVGMWTRPDAGVSFCTIMTQVYTINITSRCRPGGPPFSSPFFWSCICVEGFLARGWDIYPPRVALPLRTPGWGVHTARGGICLLYTSPSPRD